MNEVQRFFVEETRLGIPVDLLTRAFGALLSARELAFLPK
jgi:hypothetical protein